MGAPELDVMGFVRRVRRAADLSQAELADQLGVGRATVARWETGEVSPSVAVFTRLVGIAGFTLVVQDGDQAVLPMRPDGSTDRARRRLPAHLDVHLDFDPYTGEPVSYAPQRPARDFLRKGQQAPAHPVVAEQALLGDLAAAFRAKTRAWTAAHQEGHRSEATFPECTCEIDCLLGPGCESTCACGCEPRAA